jgi:AAA15 family ATPase/GTPase
VFIGKPNVGKSNILEGLGLLGAEYSRTGFMGGMVRYKELRDFFRDNDLNFKIEVKSDKGSCVLQTTSSFRKETFEFYAGEAAIINAVLTIGNNNYDNYQERLDDILETKKKVSIMGVSKSGSYDKINKMRDGYLINMSPIKKYDFAGLTKFDMAFQEFLMPPNGDNLYSVVRRDRELWNEFAKLFIEQKLELVLLDQDQEFILQKKDGPYVWQYPFFSIADTFRRFMFYITAIESNKNSVIIFEEPEVHSFPPYTQDVAYRMIYSEENQFFVSTHSPYLLQTLVSNLSDDQLNVFVTYYEDYETKVKMLTPEEIGFVQEYSTDVFFNLDRFVPNAQSANPA